MVSRVRHVEPGHIYHVLNRAADRRKLFEHEGDYRAFDLLIEETFQRTPLSILTYQTMPTHWHFAVRPANKEQLSEFFQYLSGTHAKRFRAIRGTTGEGHVYQDRFRSFPVKSDEHFLTVCRYIERNALRAGLVQRAENWRWGGLWRRLHGHEQWLESNWPVPRPENWVHRVNEPLTSEELRAIRHCIRRGRPYDDPAWVLESADQLGLRHTLRDRGRPRVVSMAGDLRH